MSLKGSYTKDEPAVRVDSLGSSLVPRVLYRPGNDVDQVQGNLILKLEQSTDPYGRKSDGKIKKNKAKLDGELYMLDISVCNINLQRGL